MHYRRVIHWGVSVLFIALGTSHSTAIRAETFPADQDGVLEDIVVTATRTAEPLSKVPLTVTAFTSQEMEARGFQDLNDISANAPGLDFDTHNVTLVSSISIRGINTNAGAPTTGVYIDDTPIAIRRTGNAYSAENNYTDLFDLERVEVLQGPQGTTFGTGSMGGVVRFITPQPSLDTYSGYTRVETAINAAGAPSWAFGSAAGGPIIDDVLGFRLSAYYHHDAGYVDRIPYYDLVQGALLGTGADGPGGIGADDRNADWQQKYTLRGALLAKIGDNFNVTATLMYDNIYANGTPGKINDYWSNPNDGTFVNAAPFVENYREWDWLASLKMVYTLPWASIMSNTSMYEGTESDAHDQTQEGLDFCPACPPPGYGQLYVLPNDPTFQFPEYGHDTRRSYTQEIRMQSTDEGRIRWSLGVFFNAATITGDANAEMNPTDNNALAQAVGYPNAFALFNANLITDPALNAYNAAAVSWERAYDRQIAGYGDLNYKITDKLTLTAGLRVSQLTYDGIVLNGGQYAGTPTVTGYRPSDSERPITPKYGVEYQADDANMFYATAAKGTRVGGGNPAVLGQPACALALQTLGLTSAPESFKTDSVWSYELGAKNRPLGGRLSLDSSIYWINWKGIQNSVFLAQGCFTYITLNALSAVSRGFNEKVDFKATDNLLLGASLGYNDAQYNKTYAPEGSVLVEKGDALPFAIPWQVAVSANYEFARLSRKPFVRADITYLSAKKPSSVDNPNTTSYLPGSFVDPSFTDVRVRAGFRTLSGIEVAAFGKNLLNKHPLYVGDVYTPVHQESTVTPRTIGVMASYRY
jgi:outer membrane receptor protein involved in Fe transport